MNQFTVIISLEEAYKYLLYNISTHDHSEPLDMGWLISDLIDILLDSNMSYPDGLDNIFIKLEKYGYGSDVIKEYLDEAVSLILNKLTLFIPEFGDDRCLDKYTFRMVRDFIIEIKINKVLHD